MNKNLLLGAMLLLGGAFAQTPTATATLVDSQGQKIGTATLRGVSGGVELSVSVAGLPPGNHGLHVHQNGSCQVGRDDLTNLPIPFGAAGGHFDPEMTRNHGGPTDPDSVGHAGDLPMLTVGADGRGSLKVTTDKLSLTREESAAGRALIIHEKPDDDKTDPAGMTGARIACGVFALASKAVQSYALPGADTFPEGVAYDAARGVLFAGSSSNGNIYQIDPNSGAAKIFSLGGSEGRQGAQGLKVDPQGRLWIAGGASGRIAILNAKTAAPVASLATPDSPQPFLNDLVRAPDGSVYVTDSGRPVLYRVSPDLQVEAWLRFGGTPISYAPGVNLNGIEITPDGRYLIAVQTNRGKLFRIDTRTKAVREIPVSGSVLYGDGLLLSGHILWVARNKENVVAKLQLSPDYTSARVLSETNGGGLRYPTTLAKVGNDVVVVNGQLDRRREGQPQLPFTLSRFPAP